ncbi:MAG: hypothetical protein Q9190_003171 [Brigantiaea leucoxantha]
MAIFAAFHLIAFPWKVYDIRRSTIVASESAPGFLPDPKTSYLGGPFGVRAMTDAYNPWDLVKAVGRGFKWIAVGRKTREQDVSYKSKISRPYMPENQDGAGGGLGTSVGNGNLFSSGRSGRYHAVSDEDEDRLLANPQAMPLSASQNTYPRPGMRLPDDTQPAGDLGSSGLYNTPTRFQHNPPPPTHPYPISTPAGPYPPRQPYANSQESGIVDTHAFEDQDTSYHPHSHSTAPTTLNPYPQSSYSPAPPHHHHHSSNSDQRSYSFQDTESINSSREWEDWSGAHGPHNQSDVALGSIGSITPDPAREHQRSRSRGPSPSEMWTSMQGHGVRGEERRRSD